MRRLRTVTRSVVDRARHNAAVRRRPRPAAPGIPGGTFERLESRALLATFSVTNLANTGAGSLRAAIQAANDSPGPDAIAFDLAGTIALRSPLPAVTGPVTIDGSTAPGFVTAPVVTVNFAGRAGLRFAAGSEGSTLSALALVRASGAGVTLDASNITIVGSYLGVQADGGTAAGNRGNGIQVNAGSSGNKIGGDTGLAYTVTSTVGTDALPVEGWQGLTAGDAPGQYIFTGSTVYPAGSGQVAGLLYVGPITAEGGDAYAMVMPDQPGQTTASTTSYSADNLAGAALRIVGTYTNDGAPNEAGFIFTGTVDDVADPTAYHPMPFPAGATWNIPHSTDGGLVVGNYDSSTVGGLPAGGGLAYVYNALTGQYIVPKITFPGSLANTAYGIWWNGGTRYTICGGYSERPENNLLDQRVPLSKAFLVDFDSSTNSFTHWKSFVYRTPAGDVTGITHFEGISGVEQGKYTLAATSFVGGVESGDAVAGFVTVYRNADGSFGDMQWTELAPPSVVGGSGGVFADSVYGNQVVGIDPTGGGSNAYQATITPRGNLISGNGGSGVSLAGSGNVVSMNTIGLDVTGTVPLANGGDGVRILAGSTGNLVGRSDPVSGIAYFGAGGVTTPVTAWQGLRGVSGTDDYLMAGAAGDEGVLYVGPIDASGGESYTVAYPDATQTSGSGPDQLPNDRVRVVGSYVAADGPTRYGFLFEGTTDDLAKPNHYSTIRPATKPAFTYARSTMGGLVVGNYDSRTADGVPVGAGKAFLYDVATSTFLDDIVFPGASSSTANGIWFNGGTSYTICGGYSLSAVNNLASDADQNAPIGQAFLVDYDAKTGVYGNWKSFSYPLGSADASFFTHFQGVSSVEKGVYTIAATSNRVGGAATPIGSFVTVRRQTDGGFGDAVWKDLSFPASTGAVATSVSGNALTGVARVEGDATPFQSTVATAFQLSNVIGGNRGNGVGIYGASGNQVAMNFIGAAASGAAAAANRGSGILITNGAQANLIGGQATGGNTPVSDNENVTPVFVRPPQGNLVSGNGGNGILITNRATANTLSGNYVGTTASGNEALGNTLDGVAIVGASGNSLLGTTFSQNPFVFYNVLSGNKGNGLRITNSNDTTVQANFMGTGASNGVVVANEGDGLLVSGSSQRTLVGGPITLGNVTSGNGRHGIELRDGVGSFTSFNTFAGLYAFGVAAPNQLNGIEITAAGGNNLVRTCLVGGNVGNGIHLGGRATGVQIEETSVGTNSDSSSALPNGASGILIDGRASGNAIGGFQPSIQARVHVSGNKRYGIEVTGRATNNRIFNTTVGAGFVPGQAIPNELGGIVVAAGTSGTQIGGTQPFMGNAVLSNTGIGISITSSSGNVVLANRVEGNTDGGIVLNGVRNTRVGSLGGGGNTVLENAVNGIYVGGNSAGTSVVANSVTGSGSNGLLINAATNLVVGGTISGEGNTIVMSTGYGIYALGTCSKTKVVRNTLRENAAGAVNLSLSTGITYVP